MLAEPSAKYVNKIAEFMPKPATFYRDDMARRHFIGCHDDVSSNKKSRTFRPSDNASLE